jgi:septal ring factor EnvC (AmiA/AmiB activator)
MSDDYTNNRIRDLERRGQQLETRFKQHEERDQRINDALTSIAQTLASFELRITKLQAIAHTQMPGEIEP